MKYMSDNMNYNPNEMQDSPESSGGGYGQPSQPNQPPNGNPYVWQAPPQQEGKGYQPPFTQQPGQGWGNPRAGSGAGPEKEKEPYQWNYAEYEQAQAAAVKPRKKRKGLMVFGILLGTVLAASVLVFAGVGIYSTFVPAPSDTAQLPDDQQTVRVPASDLPSITLNNKPQNVPDEQLSNGRLTTEQIVEKIQPSIVAITTYFETQGYSGQGLGSGIIMREDGYIVTNAHVVENAQGITVILSDAETKYEGRVVGIDTKTDLAVIKVDATGLAPAEFGNSEETKVGEKVLAIGSPQSLEFAGSVTQGIVSGLNRTLTARDDLGSMTTYSNLIQTDAAINSGNSGGALVNEYGQVIGINSAKVIATGSDGMGFAIPTSEAKPIIDDLIQYGRVTGRVMLGITASAVDEVRARLNQWPTGLLVQSTEEGSDISKKGVVPNDIITKADGQELDGFQSLSDVLDGKKPGDTVELEVYRQGSRYGESGRFFNITVELMEDMGGTSTPANQQQIPQQQAPNNTQTPDSTQNPGYDQFEEFFNYFFN